MTCELAPVSQSSVHLLQRQAARGPGTEAGIAVWTQRCSVHLYKHPHVSLPGQVHLPAVSEPRQLAACAVLMVQKPLVTGDEEHPALSRGRRSHSSACPHGSQVSVTAAQLLPQHPAPFLQSSSKRLP